VAKKGYQELCKLLIGKDGTELSNPHNPKVAGSNPAPATIPFRSLQASTMLACFAFVTVQILLPHPTTFPAPRYLVALRHPSRELNALSCACPCDRGHSVSSNTHERISPGTRDSGNLTPHFFAGWILPRCSRSQPRLTGQRKTRVCFPFSP
jgi:hypothetical protein